MDFFLPVRENTATDKREPELMTTLRRGLLVLVLFICCITTTGCKRNSGGRTSRLPDVIRESDRDRRNNRALYHSLVRGESLWRLSQMYDVEVVVLKKVNRISANQILNIGQEILIPGSPNVLLARKQKYLRDNKIKSGQVGGTRTGAAPGGTSQTRQPSKRKPTKRPPTKRKPTKYNGKSSGTIGTGTADTGNKETSRTGPVKIPPPPVKPFFVKPMQNCRVVTAYGKGEGVFTNGIILFTPDHEQVMAAAPGTVEYSGNVDKLGEVVILSHQMNFFSLYANVSRPLVVPGEKVQAGEPVAVGSSWNDTSGKSGYRAYFEIRSGDSPVDPELLMK
ncbi:MAG: hypothetical protein CVV64_18030 [Candidatus Wallbacteria bacterium HGW-Wallbacteria-1]|jgi:murein DD-endopeptidase MepM/ murein hydrolase activator NlpD|uniref:LysM domain-containing protein n=1 Tax=Candidatus Wallbacteria bacterium HGW-Wallbacteria-1 TaxID=2013854 RepID=A0A2N1PJW0_9BACT|nr:MAG: hypothetical protein CVV64_18030 [Candidatus Wallbacteria bacterium HGW-Wallbacteria-1]